MAQWACLWLCVSGWIKVRHVNDKRVDDIPVCHHSHPIPFPYLHTHTHTLASSCQLIGVLLAGAVDDKGLPAADPVHPYKHGDRGVHSSTGPSPNIELAQCWPLYLKPQGFAKAKGQSGQIVPPVPDCSAWKTAPKLTLLLSNKQHLAWSNMPFARFSKQFIT